MSSPPHPNYRKPQEQQRTSAAKFKKERDCIVNVNFTINHLLSFHF